jgi:uncharacterized membrane protein YidH (DUF202 family)
MVRKIISLAKKRTQLAQERTNLAYIRTGCSFFLVGIGLIEFFETRSAVVYFGWVAIIVGIGLFVYGIVGYRKK